MIEIDVYSLLIADTVISTSLLLTLYFYQKTQKTYPGFGYWVMGTFLVVIGYTSLWLFQLAPIGWLSLLITPIAFSTAAMLRLDGAIRFLGLKPLKKVYYIFPILFAVFSATRSILQAPLVLEDVIRPLLYGVLTILNARLFFKYASPPKPALFRLMGSILLVYLLVQISYATASLLSYFLNLQLQDVMITGFFMSITMFEVAWAIGYMMLNSQRLEAELTTYQNELHETVAELKTAMSEIKTLSGLVPICSSCKSIRDDKGYWNQLEAYLIKHSDAEFSHGICPECAKKLYPNLQLKGSEEQGDID